MWFYSDNGTNSLGFGRLRGIGGGKYELLPAPEPSTWVGIGALIVFLFFFEIKRRKASAIKASLADADRSDLITN